MINRKPLRSCRIGSIDRGERFQSVLEIRGWAKSFPGVKALQGVDFTVDAGEVHALMGENGAGKSNVDQGVTGVFPA